MTDRVMTNTYVSDVVDLQSPDDLALADKMKVGREQILAELRRIIIRVILPDLLFCVRGIHKMVLHAGSPAFTYGHMFLFKGIECDDHGTNSSVCVTSARLSPLTSVTLSPYKNSPISPNFSITVSDCF